MKPSSGRKSRLKRRPETKTSDLKKKRENSCAMNFRDVTSCGKTKVGRSTYVGSEVGNNEALFYSTFAKWAIDKTRGGGGGGGRTTFPYEEIYAAKTRSVQRGRRRRRRGVHLFSQGLFKENRGRRMEVTHSLSPFLGPPPPFLLGHSTYLQMSICISEHSGKEKFTYHPTSANRFSLYFKRLIWRQTLLMFLFRNVW